MNKFWFILGAGLGFVLGARAGRRRYERIRATAAEAWESDPVQNVADKAVGAVEKHAPAVGDVLSDTKAAVDDAASGVTSQDGEKSS